VLLDVPEVVYLSIAGQGEPGGDVFTDKIGALYGIAFTVKMRRKFAGKQDYAVCKLEALWGAEDGGEDWAALPKSAWRWHLLIRTPAFVTASDLEQAVAVLLERGKSPSVRDVRLESIVEGRCVQMLHVGPYDQEHVTVARMKSLAEEHGLKFHGRHHEIYLSDPRRVAPERLRTILRHSVAK
jgi:hypothetical protein